MRALKNFGDNHERKNRVKFHCLRIRRIGGDEFGILLGFLVNDPKFFTSSRFPACRQAGCSTFSKKVEKY